MVLPSYYLPPISWFVRLQKSDEPILVEQWANYQKQTLHNRCWIDSPNGKLALTVPIDRSTFIAGKCLMKDVQVSDHSDWQRQHWYALESSYFNSPFFEYLQDDFRPIYLKRWKWLMDLNEELVNVCLNNILQQSRPIIGRTTEYQGCSPKQHGTLPSSVSFPPPSTGGLGWVSYYQVFKEKNGFQPDLSIIDLIFNMGPESIIYLNEIK